MSLTQSSCKSSEVELTAGGEGRGKVPNHTTAKRPAPLSVLGIRMFLGLPDPDPLVRGMDWIRILSFSHKGVEQLK